MLSSACAHALMLRVRCVWWQDAEEDQRQNGDESDLHIIIFDEIDAICKSRGSTGDSTGTRDSLVNQLLTKASFPRCFEGLEPSPYNLSQLRKPLCSPIHTTHSTDVTRDRRAARHLRI